MLQIKNNLIVCYGHSLMSRSLCIRRTGFRRSQKDGRSQKDDRLQKGSFLQKTSCLRKTSCLWKNSFPRKNSRPRKDRFLQKNSFPRKDSRPQKHLRIRSCIRRSCASSTFFSVPKPQRPRQQFRR